MAEALESGRGVHLQASTIGLDRCDGCASQHFTAALLDVARRRFRKQGGEVHHRQQQLAVLAVSVKAVAQHVQKHLGRCALGRGVQRRRAQRVPQMVSRCWALAEALQQRSHGRVFDRA